MLTGADRDVRQAAAGIECIGSDVGHAVWDRDVGQDQRRIERINSDDGDRVAIYRIGGGHITTWTGVSGDGDRPVVRDERELGLHHGGQGQEE